jgi:hypothetical protein
MLERFMIFLINIFLPPLSVMIVRLDPFTFELIV